MIILKYIKLIEEYLNQEMNENELSLKFMEMWRNEKLECSEEIFLVLNALFCASDSYEPNPNIRDEDMIDEKEFRVDILNTYNKLNKLNKKLNQQQGN